MKYYNSDSIKKLKAFSPKNPLIPYKIKSISGNPIVFDFIHGYGCETQSSKKKAGSLEEKNEYFFNSFICSIEIEDLIKLAELFGSLSENSVTEDLVLSIQEGLALSIPTVYLNIDSYKKQDYKSCNVLSLINTEVATALKFFGITHINVRFITVGYGSKSLCGDSKFQDWINSKLLVKNRFMRPIFKAKLRFG